MTDRRFPPVTVPADFEVAFVVPGEAVPKQSFRFSRGGSYQKPQVVAWEQVVRLAGMSARPRPSQAMREGKWGVVLTFYRKSKRACDVDNLSKAVLDALKGVYWNDDRQIVDLHVGKSQVEKDPCVKIDVFPL